MAEIDEENKKRFNFDVVVWTHHSLTRLFFQFSAMKHNV